MASAIWLDHRTDPVFHLLLLKISFVVQMLLHFELHYCFSDTHPKVCQNLMLVPVLKIHSTNMVSNVAVAIGFFFINKSINVVRIKKFAQPVKSLKITFSFQA